MTKQEIQKLQNELVKLGYMTQEQVNTGYGTYGPKTTAAYNKYQNDIKAKTLAHKDIAPLASKFPDANTGFSAISSAPAGTLSAVANPEAGKPFTQADYDAAYTQAAASLDPYYQAMQNKDTADTEATLKEKQDSYNNYLMDSGAKFEQDKMTLDERAAEGGVLFSGGRAQKETNLKNSYERADQAKLNALRGDVGATARDFEYKYGQAPANNLSQYYSAKSNTYNPNVATGGVGSGGLSGVYNTSGKFGTGTQVRKAATEKNTAALGLLWNKGNKLMQGGYNNKY